MQTLEALLQAYDEEDPEGVRAALESPFIKHMDVEYARLAKELPIPKGYATIPPPASIRHNAAPSYVSPNQVSEIFFGTLLFDCPILSIFLYTCN